MGLFRFHRRFVSRILGNERTIAVYLPPGYLKDKRRRYPVLYLHDGQNLFDPGTAAFGVDWNAHQTADRLANERRIAAPIFVGVYNTPQRISEYTPIHDPRRQDGGRADDYVRFLVEELKPFVDHQYRTLPNREHTGTAGSSLGGLVSLWSLRKRPEVFSRCGALSPSLWWMESPLFAALQADAAWLKGARIWLDMGTHETGNDTINRAGVERCRRLSKWWESLGPQSGLEFRFAEVAGGGHCEAAWAARFGEVLEFLFPPS
jgi:predicted alpha/beta superfamily hydrolase